MTKKRDYYLSLVEKQVYKNIKTGEIVNFGGNMYEADTKKRSVIIFIGDDAVEISHDEFDSKYVKVEQ